jgi:putative ABC transport system permease protein
VQLSPAAYRTTSRMTGFYRDAITQLSSIPGVAAAGAVNWLPLGGDLISGNFYVEGRSVAPDFDVNKPAVGGDYFRAMGIALRAGRFFTDRDDAGAPGAVIISESVSRRLWPEGNPLGKRISLEDNRRPEDWLTIVGVVEDVKQNNMAEKSPPAIYQPYRQVIRASFLGNVTFVLRSDQDTASLADAVRTRIQRIDPGQPVLRIATMQDLIASSTAEPRFQAQLIGAFSVLAMILALIGIFGVISYSIAERTREIGIRMAIGARAPDLLAMVIRQGMLLVSIGILLGCAGAWGITRVLAKFLFELTPTDPPTFIGAPAIFAFIALLAILIPGRRALRVDPVAAIRNE